MAHEIKYIAQNLNSPLMCNGVDPDEMQRTLTDFMVYLDKQGLINKHAITVSNEIIESYWETYQ